jgi:hypothetical protein
MNINKEVIQLCKTNYIQVEELVYLYTLYIEEDWEMNIYPASIFKLQRLGFIDSTNKLTASGETLLANDFDIKPPKGLEETYRFEEFWSNWPKDDEHHTFARTRAIRVNKALTKLEYDKVINESKATQEELINAVKKEVVWRMSFRMSNTLKYMKSPANWLKDSIYLDTDNYILPNEVTQEEYGKNVV